MASRMRTRSVALGLALTAIVALEAPATAQGQTVTLAPDATRQVYTFLADRLEVQIVDVPQGSLRILRGGPGELEVVGRAPGGIAGAGLERNGTGRLNLTAAGAEQAVFLVVVPSDVRVRVQLPGQEVRQSFDPPHLTVTYDWPTTRAPAPAPEREEGG